MSLSFWLLAFFKLRSRSSALLLKSLSPRLCKIDSVGQICIILRAVIHVKNEAFTGPEQFGEVFDQYERKVLEARKEVTEAATEKYLGAMSKKRSMAISE